MTTLMLCFALSALARPVQGDDQSEASVPSPRDVTLETLADPEALRVLQKPGEVVFEDDFESEKSLKKYFEIRGLGQGRVTLDNEQGLAHGGTGAIRFDAPAEDGKESSSGASAWIGPKGYDRIYFRRFLRFSPDYDQGNLNHTGGGLAAFAGGGKWDQMGKAGVRPRGDDRFTSGFEPWRDWGRHAAPGNMSLYTYWMDMSGGPDGQCWGNLLQPEEGRRRNPKRGEWLCLEHMISANTVGESDGELAAWIDGELYLHMKGFRWRTSDRVKLKRFNLGIYIHRAERDNSVWYDDVVVSTGYVGADS